MMMDKEMEYSKLLDDFQVISNSLEKTKSQLETVNINFEKNQEELILLTEESNQLKEALSVSDGRCGDLEANNKLLEGRIEDLSQQIQEQSGADQHIRNLVASKTQEWEAVLARKQSELEACQERIKDQEVLLGEAQRQTHKATIIKLKKRAQTQERQLSSLQEELSEALNTITSLSDQLEGAGASQAGTRATQLEKELSIETERRRKCEEEGVIRDQELAELRQRITDYEQGVTGLSEVVEALKKKKQELVLRDHDIGMLTQQINKLSEDLNKLLDENEALREQLGVSPQDQVDLSPLRARRRTELQSTREKNQILFNEVECLKEENLLLRKQLVQAQVSAVQSEERKTSAQSESVKKPNKRPPDQSKPLTSGQDRMEALTTALAHKDQTISVLEVKIQTLQASLDAKPEGIPPESCDLVDSLNKQLSEMLDRLKQREQEVGVAQKALEKYQRKFSVMIHQQGLLYDEYARARRSWEGQKCQLEQDNQGLLVRLAALEEKINTQSQAKQLVVHASPFPAHSDLPLSRPLFPARSHDTLGGSHDSIDYHDDQNSEDLLIQQLQSDRERAKTERDKLEKALSEAQRVLLARDREVTELKTTRVSEDGGYHLERELELAKDTITNIKSELTEKEGLVAKYQSLLQDTRQELKDVTLAHKLELEVLTQQLSTRSDSTVSKLREVANEIVNTPQATGPSEPSRVRELEDLCSRQEEKIHQLHSKIDNCEAELKLCEGRGRDHVSQLESHVTQLKQKIKEQTRQHKKEMEELTASLGERGARVQELEEELEVLLGELSAAQQAVKQAPSRSMKGLVERLRAELAVREKQQRALSEALLAVRAELVETAQKTIEGQSLREQNEANVKLLVEQRTSQLQERVNELSDGLKSLHLQLELSQTQQSSLTDQLSSARRELTEVKGQMRSLDSELEEKIKSLELAKNKERKLANEIRELHLKLEQSPAELEELRRKAAILQTKLERARESRPVEEQTTVASHHGKVGGGGVARWEESKKWQRKVETLRVKLTEKQKEMDSLTKTVKTLKDTLGRSDREKCILQGKLKSVQKSNLSSKPPTISSSSPSDQLLCEREELQARVFSLESEVGRLRRQLVTGCEGDLYESRARCDQLTATVQALESQLQLTRPGSKELSSLTERECQLREELLAAQKENMTLRFDYEQAIIDLPRFKGRLEEQQAYLDTVRSGAGNVRPPSAVQGVQSVGELERVVNAMRKVIDKLQSETTSLKSKLKSSQNKVRELTTAGSKLKCSCGLSGSQPVDASEGRSGVLSSPLNKIATENDRLRERIKKDEVTLTQLRKTLASVKLENDKLRADKGNSRPITKVQSEEMVERLRAELDKKTAMLGEVKLLLREAIEREKLATQDHLCDKCQLVCGENEHLKQQVTQLKKELDCFDVSFFEEIEDLKFNYQESVKRNIELETQLKTLTTQAT